MTMNRNQYPCVEFDLDKLAANLADCNQLLQLLPNSVQFSGLGFHFFQKIIKIAVHGKECCIGVKINVKRFFVCTLTILVDHLPRKRIFVCVFTEFV